MIKIKIRKIYTTHINHVAGLPKLVRRDNIFTNRHQSCQPHIYFITSHACIYNCINILYVIILIYVTILICFNIYYTICNIYSYMLINR